MNLGSDFVPFFKKDTCTASILPGEEVIRLEQNEDDISIHAGKEIKGEKWGVINNGMQIFDSGKKTQAKFLNLQLKVGSIKRTKVNESVSDDLFSLIFRTQFQCYGMEFMLWTRSFPLVVICHDSQRLKANATIIWDNAGYTIFDTQKELPWSQVN